MRTTRAAGGDPTKPTEDDGEDDATTPDVLADITARRNAMEDGPAKSDINTLLSMLEAEKAVRMPLKTMPNSRPQKMRTTPLTMTAAS